MRTEKVEYVPMIRFPRAEWDSLKPMAEESHARAVISNWAVRYPRCTTKLIRRTTTVEEVEV